jgi:two-component system cell cycle sensor histidine kinase/response regulator CckA
MNQGTQETVGGDGSPAKRVLLLEDDVDLCQALKDWLEMNECRVTIVHRGVEGVTEVLKSDFDAIVCDMVMPLMPGDMFYLAVSKAKPHLCSRFVFITGHRDRPDIAKFLWEFHGPTLNKPLDLEELLGAVRKVFDKSPISNGDVPKIPM